MTNSRYNNLGELRNDLGISAFSPPAGDRAVQPGENISPPLVRDVYEKEHRLVSQAEMKANWGAAMLCGVIICYYSEKPDSILSWIWLGTKCLIGGYLSGIAILGLFGWVIWPNVVSYVYRLPLSQDPVLRADEYYALLFPESEEASRVERRVSCEVDHLVYPCADLDEGVEAIYELTGVWAKRIAKRWNKHRAWGTQNAVMSLGDCAYLEIIAPDPDRTDPDTPVTLFGLNDDASLDRLGAFAVHPNPATKGATMELIAQRVQLARGNPGTGKISGGHGVNSSGKIPRWKLTSPHYAKGSTPFVIEWIDCDNPASTARAPKGCKIRKLTVYESNDVQGGIKTKDFFKYIGLMQDSPVADAGRVEVEVKETIGPGYLVAELDTPKGRVSLS